MKRVFGFGLLIVGLVLGGAAAVQARTIHSGVDQPRPCTLNGVSYPVGSYCYTSCAPTAACDLMVCFTGGLQGGEWINVGACKVRDCRNVCAR